MGTAGDLDAAALVAIGTPVSQQHNPADAAPKQRALDFLHRQGHAGCHLGAACGLNHADHTLEVGLVTGALGCDHRLGAVVKRHQRKIVFIAEQIEDAGGPVLHLLEPLAPHRGTAVNHEAEVQG